MFVSKIITRNNNVVVADSIAIFKPQCCQQFITRVISILKWQPIFFLTNTTVWVSDFPILHPFTLLFRLPCGMPTQILAGKPIS
jgi:hypothetical protein